MNSISLLDGAMGTEFIRLGIDLPEHIWSAHMNLFNPDLVFNLHKSYINAGSSYITTNTFRATPRAYKKTGITLEKARELAKKSFKSAIKMAKKASCQKAKILGSIAPLEDCYYPEQFPGEKQAKYEFFEIGEWFNNAGIDIFLLETMNSIIETKICLESIHKYNIPIWVSFNLLNSNQIQSGEDLIKAIKFLQNYNVDCILLNCNSLERTKGALRVISENWSKKWGIYPNLGLGNPSPDGIIKDYDSTENFLITINMAIELGASMIGGCCGTNPNHIKLLKEKFIV